MSHRWRNFLFMIPFFVIGIGIPVYYFGINGDGGAAPPPSYSSPSSDMRPSVLPQGREVVSASRDFFERTADRWETPHGPSRLSIQLLTLGGLFAAGYLALRIALAGLSSFEGVVGSTEPVMSYQPWLLTKLVFEAAVHATVAAVTSAVRKIPSAEYWPLAQVAAPLVAH